MLVDGLLHLEADGPESVGDHLSFALAEVERLGGVVVEEMVAADALAQRRAVDEVGREEQSDGVRLALSLLLGHVDAHHLPWGEANDGALLVVVFPAAVVQRALYAVLQPQGIEAVAQRDVVGTMVGGGVGDVHHAHHGVKGLEAIHLVILVDAVDGDNRLVCHIGLSFLFTCTKLAENFCSRKRNRIISAIRVIAAIIGVRGYRQLSMVMLSDYPAVCC